MLYCSATFTHNYLVMVADDYFYNYVGKLINISITDYIHPDFKEEFTNICESLKEGESQRMIAYMKGKDDTYTLVHILLSNTGHVIEDNSVIEAEVYNVFNTGKKYFKLHDDADKYKKFLSMYNDYLFDYDIATGIISIYVYRSMKATMIKKMHIDDFEKYIMTFFNNARHKQDFRDFMYKLRNANEGFNAEITCPLITDSSKLGLYKVDCRIITSTIEARWLLGLSSHLVHRQRKHIMRHRKARISLQGCLTKEHVRNMYRMQYLLTKTCIMLL